MRRLSALMLLFSCGCADPGSLRIVAVPIPSGEACTLTASEEQGAAMGYYDPYFSPVYVLTLSVRNDLTPPSDQKGTVFGADFRSQTNDVSVNGVDLCWYVPAAPIANTGSGFVDCGNLPSDQNGFAVASGNISEAGGLGVAVAETLPLTALQVPGVFGASFDPEEPQQRSLVLQASVVGSTSGGHVVRSSWFQFPISVISNHDALCKELGPAYSAVDADNCLPGSTPDRGCQAASTSTK